jgi:mRNA-degrading endonuclease toxin of MazEF toxin-antitoxin module
MAQSIVKRGSVVLIRYPFTDLTSAKVRPALVLTPDHLLPRLEDVLCLFISSAMPAEPLPTDFVLEPGHASFLNTGLKRCSVLRMHKLALLHKALVLRVLGEGDQPLLHEVNQRLRLALGLQRHIAAGHETSYRWQKPFGAVIWALMSFV